MTLYKVEYDKIVLSGWAVIDAPDEDAAEEIAAAKIQEILNSSATWVDLGGGQTAVVDGASAFDGVGADTVKEMGS